MHIKGKGGGGELPRIINFRANSRLYFNSCSLAVPAKHPILETIPPLLARPGNYET